MKTMFGATLSILAMGLVAGCGSKGGGYHPADGGPDSGGDGAACPAGGTGQLVLAMTGLPAGVTPMVRVSSGASMMLLMAGTPVTVNAGGGYVIETRRVKTAPATGSVIGKAFQATTTFDGCVKADTTTTAMVTFVQEPGSDKMWVTTVNAEPPHDKDPVGAFAGSDLIATAAKDPTVWLSMNTVGRGGGGAFDFYGNFWLPAGDRINMYGAATLGASNSTAPGVTLTQPTSATATFAAFDADGNLWVTRSAPGTERSVVRYAAATLGSSTATPSVVITLGATVNPRGLAFDASGALWVTDDEGEKLLKFAAGRLAASTSAAADVVITTKTPVGAPVQGPYTDPNPLAFDKTGNLWVGYAGNTVKLTPAQQAASADIAGPFSIDVPGGTGAFAFDESGGLWISASGGKVQRIPAAMLAGAGGEVTPDIVVTSAAVGGTENLVINPAPTWSFIHDAL